MTPPPLPRGEGWGEGLTRRAALAAIGALAATPAQACTRAAELPLRLIESFPVVSATLAGQPVSFVLDTAAQGMLVTPAMAAALGLPIAGATRIFGTGGSIEAPVVRLTGLRLGGARMPDTLSPVAPLPLTLTADPPLAGLLGANLLARFDVDLDIPARRIALYAARSCPAPAGGTVLPMQVSRAGEPYLPVRINGQVLLALVDTGSRATLLTRETAARLGVQAPISANTAPGIDGERLPVEHSRVRLSLAGEPETDTPVSIAPIQLDHADLLLGMNVLARRRVWLGYADQRAVVGPREA